MCPNRVLQKYSALSIDCIRSSLTQDVVRRLLNCSENLSNVEKAEILSTFSRKMLNSGHSPASVQILLVHGVVKYQEIVRRSKLPREHPNFQPIHFDKDFKKCERKLRKSLAKSGWYSSESKFGANKSNWRSKLPKDWVGAKFVS